VKGCVGVRGRCGREMCGIVIVESGLRLRRMRNGYVKWTECLRLSLLPPPLLRLELICDGIEMQ
jgi:hypothetical protein